MAPIIQKRKTAHRRCPLFTDPGPDVRTVGAPPSRPLVHTSDPEVAILAVPLCVSARSPDHEHNDTDTTIWTEHTNENRLFFEMN